MPTLRQYQREADKAAAKLEIEVPVLVRWIAPPCRLGRNTGAHCHIKDGMLPRGTICIRKGLKGAKEWMAHEVAHLCGKGHESKSFLRAVAKILPKSREAIAARQINAIPHRHSWIIRRIAQIAARSGCVLIEERCPKCETVRTVSYVRRNR